MASSTPRRAGYAALVLALLGEPACAAPVTQGPAKPTAAPVARIGGEPVKRGSVVPKVDIVDPVVTVLVRLDDLTPEVRARLLEPRNGDVCDCIVSPIESVVITDTRSNIEHLLRRPIPVPQRAHSAGGRLEVPTP
jgi:hypothetical protein